MFAARFNVNDPTYDYLNISITTVLEPILGIIVASIPIFPPTFKECLGGGSEHNSPNVRSSYTAGRHSNSLEQSPFPLRLDNSYPLADLEMYRQENKATGSGSRASCFRIERSTDSRGETDPYSMIDVR